MIQSQRYVQVARVLRGRRGENIQRGGGAVGGRGRGKQSHIVMGDRNSHKRTASRDLGLYIAATVGSGSIVIVRLD